MLRLLIEDSEGKSKLAPISPESSEITIGRKAGNVIRLKERNVSREHAKIYQNAEGLFVEPVAARYGMKVNGSKIDGPTHIELGDEIRIGDYRLYVQDESQEQPVKEEAAVSEVPVPLTPDQQPRLVVISSNFAGREYPITSTRCTLGRAPDSNICIQHPSVSSTHAEIVRNRNGNFEIRDLNSSNGTKVNGQDLGQASHELQSGDMIAFGHVITRFCAPGELWYFNFGSTSEPKRNTALMAALIVAIIVVAILGTVVVMMTLAPHEQPSNPELDEAAMKEQAEQAAKNDFMAAIMSCNMEINNGNFEIATEFCNKAEQINPNDERLSTAQSTLRREINAQRDYEQIETWIDEHTISSCRKALNAIAEIEIGTFAYRKLTQKAVKESAQECLEQTLLEKGKNEVDEGNLSSAEQTLNEMQSKGRAHSPHIEALAEAIKAKKAPERTSRPSSGGSSKSKSSGAAPAAPAASSDPGMSESELCALAVRAKLKKDYATVCKYGKQAQKAGGAAACGGKVKEYIGYCK